MSLPLFQALAGSYIFYYKDAKKLNPLLSFLSITLHPHFSLVPYLILSYFISLKTPTIKPNEPCVPIGKLNPRLT